MQKLRKILKFLFMPDMGKLYWLRVLLVAVLAFVFFRFFCMPMVLDGGSMEPNYHSGTLNFCWVPAFWFHAPKRGEAVVLKFGGNRVFLLKRIIALEGDTVEFRHGVLYLNGKAVDEPYIKYKRAPWNLPLRRVEAGHVYVVGDNRSMPMYQHKFGQIHAKRIQGKLIL